MSFKKIFTTFLIFFVHFTLSAQEDNTSLSSVVRVNIFNPSLEYEHHLLSKVVVSSSIGYGYGVSYPRLTSAFSNGFSQMYAPFIDVQLKNIYNREKRQNKGKNLNYNSGNYWGIRTLVRGKEGFSTFTRTDDFDVAIGPYWGIQRSYGNIFFQFNLGMAYYFDSFNNGFNPIITQLKIGYNLKSF